MSDPYREKPFTAEEIAKLDAHDPCDLEHDNYERLLAAARRDAERARRFDSPEKPHDGIFNKYNVERTDGSSEPGGKHERCYYFVLDWKHDRYAVPAALAYADACEAEIPELASDLRCEAQRAREREGHAAVNAAAPCTPDAPKRTEWVARDLHKTPSVIVELDKPCTTKEEAEAEIVRWDRPGRYVAEERERPATLEEQLADAREEIERLRLMADDLESKWKGAEEDAMRMAKIAETHRTERDAALRFEVTEEQRERAIARLDGTAWSRQNPKWLIDELLAALREPTGGAG